MFVGIAWYNFLEPEVDERSILHALRWRRSSGRWAKIKLSRCLWLKNEASVADYEESLMLVNPFLHNFEHSQVVIELYGVHSSKISL